MDFGFQKPARTPIVGRSQERSSTSRQDDSHKQLQHGAPGHLLCD
jgi:hypothetical protein